uniref:phytanoyl-CoA dioxygenase family protein n=1 Tax=Pseudonocardia pini TaxID=2758030 RepID=UPI0015F0CEBF
MTAVQESPSPSDLAEHIRSVTDEELAQLREHGWVVLRGLVSPELAGAMRRNAVAFMGEDGAGHRPRPGVDDEYVLGDVENFHYPWKADALLGAVATSPVLGANAARLLGRPVAMRLFVDALGVNLPASRTGRTGEVRYHQPCAGASYDRDVAGFSIALDAASPEQGSLRYWSGSHRRGVLGTDKWTEAELRADPRLDGCLPTEPLTLAPGDATAHDSSILLGVPANTTETARWSYVLGYVPADARYTGVPSRRTDGRGLVPGALLEHEDYPVVHSPSGAEPAEDGR